MIKSNHLDTHPVHLSIYPSVCPSMLCSIADPYQEHAVSKAICAGGEIDRHGRVDGRVVAGVVSDQAIEARRSQHSRQVLSVSDRLQLQYEKWNEAVP